MTLSLVAALAAVHGALGAAISLANVNITELAMNMSKSPNTTAMSLNGTYLPPNQDRPPCYIPPGYKTTNIVGRCMSPLTLDSCQWSDGARTGICRCNLGHVSIMSLSSILCCVISP